MSTTNDRTDEIRGAEAVEDDARKNLETAKAEWEKLSSTNDTTTTLCGNLLDKSRILKETEIALSDASYAVRELKLNKECSKLEGGRRRRSRKHTKKHRKTRRRHH